MESNTKTKAMKNTTHIFLLILGMLSLSCSSDADVSTENKINEEETAVNLYFPPLNTTEWETTTFTELKWDEVAAEALYAFLEEKIQKLS